MHMTGKVKYNFLILLVIGIAGFSVAGFISAQYDYYDPYSNSNIDYFPTNPINTSPSKTGGGSATGGGASGSTSVSPSPRAITNTATLCANKPKINPQNTRSVEVRDKSGKVFYLSPPKEELVGIKAYPETSQQIFKIIYGASGMQVDEKEIGLITVDNKCYPKYGYVQNDSTVATPQSSISPSSPLTTQYTESAVVPEDTTAVNLNLATGEVFNAKTGLPINDARYDTKARKIYYKNTYSIFGKVLTDTTGYVNIDPRILGATSPMLKASPSPAVKFKSIPKLYDDIAPIGSSPAPVIKEPTSIIKKPIPTVPAVAELPSSGNVVISFIEGGQDAISVGSNGKWTKAKIGMMLEQGQDILASPNGSAVFLFSNGSKMRLASASQMRIVSYGIRGDSTQTEILLRVGQIAVAVEKEQSAGNDFKIVSPTATISVRGTRFLVKYDKTNQESQVDVNEGMVEVTGKRPWYRAWMFWKKSANILLKAGNRAIVNKKGEITTKTLSLEETAVLDTALGVGVLFEISE